MSSPAAQYSSSPARQWHYVLDDCRLGPLAEEYFMPLVANGKIPLNTEVWYKGLKQWTPLERLYPGPPPPQAASGHSCLSRPVDACQPGPWLRLLARSLDLLMFLPFSAWLLNMLPASGRLPDIGFLLLTLLMVIVIEAFCLRQWGATPAKGLLGISVKQKSGHKLTLSQAMLRSALAWILGTGLFCSWVLSLAFLWASYNLLTRRGAALWDMEPAYQLHYRPSAPLRKLAAAAMSLSCLCLLLPV